MIYRKYDVLENITLNNIFYVFLDHILLYKALENAEIVLRLYSD